MAARRLVARRAGAQATPTITVGLDGSPAAVEAVRYAVRLAAPRDARVLVVTAYDVPHDGAAAGADAVADLRRAVQERQRRTLAQVLVPGSVRVTTTVRGGAAVSVLRALSTRSSLLVLGQRRPAHGPRLGDEVVGRVAEQAVCPVVVVPQGCSRTGGRGPVLVALDGQAAGAAAVRLAFEEADARRATVWVLHVAAARHPSAQELEAERVGLARLLAAGQRAHPGVPLRLRVVTGDPVGEVLRLSSGVGLVVVGRPHRPDQGSWRHSLARSVLGRTGCPLAIAAVTAPTTQRTTREVVTCR